MAPKVAEKIQQAQPVVKRLAKDDKFKKHLGSAYGSARSIYDEIFAEGGVTTEASAKRLVARLASEPDLQDELRNVVSELRAAGGRAKKTVRPTHKSRNSVLLAGILIGILYNPKTGPETRRWLKEKIFGPEETFEFET
jgi:hypothetical protein